MMKIFSQINIDPSEINVPQTNTPDSATISDIMSIVFAIAGGVALIVIIIAGIQFMLSRGEPQKAATARSAIIYAAIGLVISTLAFSIVTFVVGEL